MNRRQFIQNGTAASMTAGLVAGVPALSAANPPDAAEPPNANPATIGVQQFGAIGDGKADDTAAMQRAIDAVAIARGGVSVARTATVLVEPGQYRITAPLKIGPQHAGLVLQGTSGILDLGGTPGFRPERVPKARAQFFWDGPEGGTLLEMLGCSGVTLRQVAFSGERKAGRLITLNSPASFGAGGLLFDQVAISYAAVGFACSTDSYINSADITFRDVTFASCGTGFETNSDQNVNYLFLRCGALMCATGIHMKKGGNLQSYLWATYSVGTVVQIDTGGINAGAFHFSGMRIDNQSRRSVVLRARGEVNVKFSALNVIIAAVNEDTETPIFDLGPHVSVSVESSMLTGKIATLAGIGTNWPTWIQFDNCRFRGNADPRTRIDHDANSGYQLRNCMVEGPEGRIMIPELTKLPEKTASNLGKPAGAEANG